MADAVNRMQFLRGDLRGTKSPQRPPWALFEDEFVANCTRCGKCVDACFDGLIRTGRGGFPEMNFAAGGCDFCGDCVTACEPAALVRQSEGASPWLLTASILEACLSLNAVICRSCGEACDTHAIVFKLQVGGRATPILDQQQCTGCGECFAVCPADAIRISSQTIAEKVATNASEDKETA